MNKILTAKEWLKTVTLTKGCADPDTMERYASYKTKVLEDKIGEFRMYLLLNIVPYSADDTIQRKYLKDFENIFNIATEK